MLGGQLRLVTTGGAPLTAQVMNFSRVIYGCPLFEGYGQTECSAAGTLSLPFDTQSGHVGGPAAWAQIKLVDVPELKYFSIEDRGEVCFRGAGVMTGYYNNDDATTEAIDEQGWLHTGDIGMWLPNGSLRIIDRKKHFFKLAQGDYVSPEQIENVYHQHPLVNQIFVDGWTTKSFLIAIIVTNVVELRALLSKQTDQQVNLL
uniref:long-chain-fatty-acid--CoA ligase n=1 Tax=Acrobeloides nanus TaxID=290746 RepID=A0A914DA52_9BILA